MQSVAESKVKTKICNKCTRKHQGWCMTLWMLCLQKHCDCIYQHLSPQGKLAVNSCISPDIFISPSPHLQHNFNKTQSRGMAQYWHHLITKTPVIHLQQINGSGVLWKAFKASCYRREKLHVTADNQSLDLMAFNFGRNRAYRWQDWNVRSSEVNISITHVSQKHLTNLKPLAPDITELRAALLFSLEDHLYI